MTTSGGEQRAVDEDGRHRNESERESMTWSMGLPDADEQPTGAQDLVDRLRCPECRGRVRAARSEMVMCEGCGRAYPRVRGVPCLLPASMLEGDPAVGTVDVPKDITEHAKGGEYHWNAFGIETLLPRSGGGRSVLLVGCGDAGERDRLVKLGFEVEGFDIHWSPGTDFLGDAHRIPVADESYDIAISMQVLEHVHSPWIAVEEMARVLRPGGWLIGSVAFLKAYHGSYFHITHAGMTRLLEGAGLAIDRLYGAQSLTYTLYGGLLPLGKVEWRRRAGAAFDRLLRSLRARYWSVTRHLDPDEPTDRFGAAIPLSFRTFDGLRFAPAVVFRARKPLDSA